MPPKNNLKVVLVGDSGVGKSTIISRFRGERYNPCYVQTREREIKNIEVQVGRGKPVGIQVWDTPGSDQCRTITAAYVKEDVKGVIVVFDVSNEESFFDVQHWVRTVKEYTGDDGRGISYIFVGNKVDKERKVRAGAGSQLADQHNGVYFETSAKTSQNIKEVFIEIAKRLTSNTSSSIGDSCSTSEPPPVTKERGGFCTLL